MVDDEDLVGQEQHEVALVRLALQLVVDRVELEGEVVAEGAVEAEMGAFAVA